MRRRSFIRTGAIAAAATVSGGAGSLLLAAERPKAKNMPASSPLPKLTPPIDGRIGVAVALSQGATVIDFAGPWEVFQDVMLAGSGQGNDSPL